MTERFLQGFGEVREVQTTIAHTYENEVLKPAKEMAGLYAIIEGAIGERDALLLPSLGKSREAFTASLVAANAFYLSLASDAADEARRNIATVEADHPGDDRPRRERPAARRAARARPARRRVPATA